MSETDIPAVPLLSYRQMDDWRQRLRLKMADVCRRTRLSRAVFDSARATRWSTRTYEKIYSVYEEAEIEQQREVIKRRLVEVEAAELSQLRRNIRTRWLIDTDAAIGAE